MVGVGRVHPPGVDTHLVQAGEVLPVDVARLLGVHVVATHTTHIIHAGRPEAESALRPGVERHEMSLLLQFLVGLGVGAER